MLIHLRINYYTHARASMLTYLSSNQQQPLHSLPQSGALGLQERLGAGPGVVGDSFLHQGLTAGFPRQQRPHGRQHALH